MGWVQCPHCKTVVDTSAFSTFKYIGSPIVVCTKCRNTIIDEKAYEWAAIPFSSRLFYCCFANYRACIRFISLLVPISCLSSNWLLGFFLIVISETVLCSILYFLVKRFNGYEIDRSLQRVSDPKYIDLLAQSGYTKLDLNFYQEYIERRDSTPAKKLAPKLDPNFYQEYIERRDSTPAKKSVPIAVNHTKKRELRDLIAKLKKDLKEFDKSYEENKKILLEAYSDKELAQMVANGEFSADCVVDYKEQRRNLEMIISFMPIARETMIKHIDDLAKELAELECE